MEFGVHLPQIEWDGERVTLDRLLAVATTAERLGYGTLTANDHLVYGRPWLDGPTALAAVMAAAPSVRLMTSVSLAVVRGPFALAKSLAAIDQLSDGRVDAGLGPGSSAADYALVGIPFEERWARFDEAVATMRALWDPDRPPFVGPVLRHHRRHPVAARRHARRARRSGSAAGAPRRGFGAWRASGTAGWRPGTTRARRTSRTTRAVARRAAAGRRPRPVGLPVDAGDVLALRHRRSRQGASRRRAPEPDAAPLRGRGPYAPADRIAGSLRRPVRRATRRPAWAGCWSGRSGTSSSRSSASRRTSSPPCRRRTRRP